MDRGGWNYPSAELRVSDADRDQALSELRQAFGAGRLTAEEYQQRSGQALSSRTGKELTALLADLPVEHAPAPRSTPEGRAQRDLSTRVAIGIVAAAAASFGFIAVAAGLNTGPTVQQQEAMREAMAQHGFPVPPIMPSSGFNWAGAAAPAVIAVVLVMVLACLCARLARASRT